MYMYVDMCVHVNKEARGEPWVLPQELSTLILFESRFIKAENLLIMLGSQHYSHLVLLLLCLLCKVISPE